MECSELPDIVESIESTDSTKVAMVRDVQTIENSKHTMVDGVEMTETPACTMADASDIYEKESFGQTMSPVSDVESSESQGSGPDIDPRQREIRLWKGANIIFRRASRQGPSRIWPRPHTWDSFWKLMTQFYPDEDALHLDLVQVHLRGAIRVRTLSLLRNANNIAGEVHKLQAHLRFRLNQEYVVLKHIVR